MVFLAGVATATLMDGDKLVATANTLLDSSITVGVSMEEIRAGTGNKLYGKYAHSSTFDLKLTDAMFNLEYLAMNTGSEIEIGGDVIQNEKLTAGADLKLTLSKTAVPMSATGTNIYAYAFQVGKNPDYIAYQVAEDNSITVPSAGEWCVRYMYNNADASRMVISSNFIPKTLSVILEANLYSGGSCDVSTSTLAGKLIIKVYRFMLNGNQELSMTASGVSQTSIEGSALSSGCEGCDGDGAYAEIVQVLEGESWHSKAAGIMIEDAYQEFSAGETISITPVAYAWFNNAAPKRLDAADVEYSFEADGTSLSWDGTKITGTAAAGTAVLKAVSHGMEASLTIVVA